MQLVFAGMIVPLKRKKPALLVGIYIRVVALMILALFLNNLSGEAVWKVWAIMVIMTIFSFSGAFSNISYTDIMGKVIAPPHRKRLLMVKQLISSVGVIVSALLVKIILSRLNYPKNYSLLFLLAGLLLLLGTIGFWLIKEPATIAPAKTNMRAKIKEFGAVLKGDPNFRKYLLLMNTTGVITTTVPFFILFARQKFLVDGSLTGTFLLVQMAGGLIAMIGLNLFSKTSYYRLMVYLFVIISALTPITALLVPAVPQWYALVFLLGGVGHSIGQVVSPGVLLEISTDENRAIYTGLSGAGSIMQVLYPLLAGFMVGLMGFKLVFMLTTIFILIGLYVAKTIQCIPFITNIK